MSVTDVTPTLVVAGQPVVGRGLGSPIPTDGTLIGIGGLSISWGRESVLESATPATASVTVSDRSAARVFARRTDLIGLPLVLGWEGASPVLYGTNFRGRITDVQRVPRKDRRGFDVRLSASSVEVDLANYAVAKGTTWAAETFGARRTRIAALIPSGTFTGGVTLPDRLDLGLPTPAIPGTDLSTLTAAQVDAGGKNVLELLHELYASTSAQPMVYDPGADRFTFAPRRRFAFDAGQGLTMSARLQTSANHGGRYIATSLAGLHLDANHLGYDGSLDSALDNRLTRVEVTYRDSTASYAQRTATVQTVDTEYETVIGRRVLGVDTIHSTAANATQLANLYAEVVNNEARLPRLGALNYSTAREPFADTAHVTALLAGWERGDVLFVSSSWLPQLGARPLLGIIGGSIEYRAGVWSLDLTPAPVTIDSTPYGWGGVTAFASASSTAVHLAHLDPSVTAGDFGSIDVGAGYTTTTALPYKGNPL